MKKIIFAACILLLTACGGEPEAQQAQQSAQSYQQPVQQQVLPQQQFVPAPQPVVIQQAPQQSSGMQDMLIGGLIGHSLANSGSSGSQRTIVNKTVINRTYVAPRKATAYRRK